ncbi:MULTISPECIES: cell division protein FtsB [Rubrivivax]|uniref:Cell division protein FtsB n=1 Tax=Rubrivivax benzoatilyticus TaxID=316997 RepID=A0ABX0HVM0_9BURK|nr:MULTISPECIES: cell division protein FtsB [Rubrivivax]MCD0418242.1 cell division protein FtsB [Rubrivivax sp. JA1024]EGJ11123.1 septum formation initiator [Rubrivivax benzoatilyticus JA2 = ATCC BAA-35]MCC9595991.1 cell division protein FtsB [Rubrivivax sp. JA1055]MCC9647668.1 cell division protein FtsB [Rubrivivax sp. JA1029]NHK97588.1 cell division protein FtsB [Rubrivivax benzoatilyticus]
MRWLSFVLAGLLAAVQADLWFGRSSVPYTMSLRTQLAAQQAANDQARERNARLEAEVSDLKEGLEMVEEKARAELGMVKPDEILVQVAPPRR